MSAAPSVGDLRELTDGERARAATAWIALAMLSLAAVAATYWSAVRTVGGQRAENAALRGALQVNSEDVVAADAALATFTVASLGVAVLVLAVIGWVRGGLRLGAVAVAVVAGGTAVTEVLKRYLLTRPPLIDAPDYWLHNSFPSGHTTVAMCVACAALLVVSWRWRTLAMMVVTAWTVGVGAYTVVARWHRLSDTLGADAIALAAASIGALYLLRRGLVQRVSDDRRAPVRTVLIVLAAVYVTAFGAVGVAVGLAGLGQDAGSVADYNIYLAAQSLASVGSILTILLAWASWHRLETVRR